MMSNFNGHDRPFPHWFPYAIGAVPVGAYLLYQLVPFL
jgi:hypothetical protein